MRERGAGLHGYLAPECQLLSIRAIVCLLPPPSPYLVIYFSLWFASMAVKPLTSASYVFSLAFPHCFRPYVTHHLIFEHGLFGNYPLCHFCGFDIGRGRKGLGEGAALDCGFVMVPESLLCGHAVSGLLLLRCLVVSLRFSSWGPLTAVL